MLEILEFIFQSFWHFVGIAILLEVIFGGIRGKLLNRNAKEANHPYCLHLWRPTHERIPLPDVAMV